MLISLLLNVVGLFFSGFVNLLSNIPACPDDLMSTLTDYIDLIANGSAHAISWINYFIPVSWCVMLLEIVLAIEVFEEGYYLINWILKKVPLLGWD